MTSIDEIFNKSGVTGNKRKFEPGRDPDEIYKSAKLSVNGDAKGKEHAAKVEDEDEDDVAAGPELPPDDDEEARQDDEEGRFFGGGVSKDTAEVLDFIDGQEETDATPEKIDASWLRRLALGFERHISKNSELRAKFEDDPEKFMSSEADLDSDVKSLSILADHPELYVEFAKLGCVTSLVSLLAHENTDIAIAAIQVLSELTDEDVQAEQDQWETVVDAMLDADLASLLVDNLSRFDERDEADRNGIYHSLSLVENLASQSQIAEKLAESSLLLKWLLARVQNKESPVSQNLQYAAEVLAILLQSSQSLCRVVIDIGGVDSYLLLLSAYRKRDPAKDTDEEEFVENLFDGLICLVDDERGKIPFVEAEGVELCLIMLKESKFSKPRALRVLDHAMSEQTGTQVCEKLVEAAGLKVIFSMFMKNQDYSVVEHLLGIFASLLRRLPGDSAPRIRTLAKFLEKDYEKAAKLVKLRSEYSAKLDPIDKQIGIERADQSAEDQEANADQWLSRRLDAGLFSLHTVDVILAWLVAEDDGARKKIDALLTERGRNLANVKESLLEQLDGADLAGTEDRKAGSDMIRTLVDLLQI